jgi:diguanylate cyclase (GGDEF)-like protein/PAS domain S-box-containing protein
MADKENAMTATFPLLVPAGHDQPASILIVEDEAIVALDLQSQLEEMGYRVCGVADNGMDAIASARKLRPSVILMDIVIKGKIDGVDVAHQIERWPHIPVIFLTAYSDASTVARVARAAPYGYLTKPFRAEELRAAIEVALFKAALERQLRDSERWFTSTLRSVADGIIATDEQHRIRFMNPTAEQLLGCPLSQAYQRNVDEIFKVEDRITGALHEAPVRRALAEGHVVGLDFGSSLVTTDGRRVPIDETAAPVRDEEGHILGAVLVFRSVQQRLETEEKLRQSEQHFRNVFDLAPVGMALQGLDGRFLKVNQAMCNLLGYPEQELLALDPARLACGDNGDAERTLLDDVRAGHTVAAQFEKRYLTREGGIVWALASISLLHEKNEPLCYLLQLHDVTERKDAESRLAQLAHADPLTGLANRAWLSDEISRQIQLASRHRSGFAVVFIDLDHFKQVNDTYGHEAGDELLKSVAKMLKGAIREVDAIARLGGDEFVVLLTDIAQQDDVLHVTDKLRSECARPFQVAGEQVRIGLSLGVSMYPDDALDARTLLRYADSALYHAKAEGRNNVQFYRPELTARMRLRMTLETGLRDALALGQFVMYFQPIVSLADGGPLMAEALIRWQHPTLGLLLPDTFLPLAEETGYSDAIGTWVLEQACRVARTWPVTGGREVNVAVNVSPRQFHGGALIRHVTQALAASALPPQRVCIEITEQTLLENSDTVTAMIDQLKAPGGARRHR